VDGQRRWATKVVGIVTFLPDGRRNGNGQHAATEPAASHEAVEAHAMEPEIQEIDEDVPF
jgi:hypothetical protein